jgi:acid phosphatase
MKIFPALLAFSVLSLAGCQAPEPRNVTFAKKAATDYHNDGRYEAQFLAVTDQVQKYLSWRATHAKPGQKLAVVFDLDETLLSNWPFLSEYGYSRNIDLVKHWMEQSRCPVLPSSMALYREALGLRMQVFFITGRRTPLRAATLENLKRIGVTQFAKLDCRPMADTNASVIPYKSACRQAITDAGYEIVMNIGDQWSDLKGGYAERTFKLPDPFYYIQ